jgi:hypothetical protein
MIASATQAPALAGAATAWGYTAGESLGPSGIYKLWIEARDAAGNSTTLTADDLNWTNLARRGGSTVYMPFVRR